MPNRFVLFMGFVIECGWKFCLIDVGRGRRGQAVGNNSSGLNAHGVSSLSLVRGELLAETIWGQ